MKIRKSPHDEGPKKKREKDKYGTFLTQNGQIWYFF